MKKTQIWCDGCGRELSCKTVETGDGFSSGTDSENTWELWSKDTDWIFCSLDCLLNKAADIKEKSK